MSGVVTDSPEMLASLLLFGCAGAIAAVVRRAVRAARKRDAALAREAIAGATLLALAAAFAFHRQQPRRIDDAPAAAVAAPAAASRRVERSDFVRRSAERAEKLRRQLEREDADRRTREQQEREQLLARILAGER